MTDNPQIALDNNGFVLIGPVDNGARQGIQDEYVTQIARPLVRADGASCLTDEEIESIVLWAWENTNLDRVGTDGLREELRRLHSWTPPTVHPWADDEIVVLESAQGRSVYTRSGSGYECYGARFDTADDLADYAKRHCATIRRAVFVKDGE